MSDELACLDDGRAIYICTTSDTAFGPVFESHDLLWAFDSWIHHADTRRWSDSEFEQRFADFMASRRLECKKCGELHVIEEGELCCACQYCERCGEDGATDCGDYGWLCGSCGVECVTKFA